MTQAVFEPEGVYRGVPFKVLEGGQIDAMMTGVLVRFKSMDQFTAAVSGVTNMSSPATSNLAPRSPSTERVTFTWRDGLKKTSAADPKRTGIDLDTRHSKRRLAWVCVILLILGFAWLGGNTTTEPGGRPESSSQATPTRSEAATSTLDASDVPGDQARFLEVVEEARRVYAAGRNEMEKGSARPQRARAICNVLRSLSANGWLGEIKTLSTNNDGRGILSIRIGKDIHVTTWNNAVSDISTGTLISPNSALYEKVKAKRVGQRVAFVGTFFRGLTDADCIQESSLTMQGSMTSPDFIFKFSDVGVR